jgi:hypothetical protein
MNDRRIRLGERAVLAMMGWVCGMALGLLLYFTWKVNESLLTFLPLGGMVLALWYAQQTGKIPAGHTRPTGRS